MLNPPTGISKVPDDILVITESFFELSKKIAPSLVDIHQAMEFSKDHLVDIESVLGMWNSSPNLFQGPQDEMRNHIIFWFTQLHQQMTALINKSQNV